MPVCETTSGRSSLEERLSGLSVSRKDVVSIVFIGHVDAGKSTIGGQILNKLGMIDDRTLDKYRKQAREKNRESWYLSWALDTDEGERERGKTAEVGRAYFMLGMRRVVLLDAPGHSMYVSDMISGANQADIAVLVVSARRSEFEAGFEKDGQTREHVYLSRAGGIRRMVVLVNKMDEAGWEERRFSYIKQKLKLFLQRIYGQQEVVYIPISGIGGENILERNESCEWYKGKTFLGFLEEVAVERPSEPLFSFTVVEKVRNMGAVTLGGKVETGYLSSAKVHVMPKGLETYVTSIYDEEDVEIDGAVAGDFVRIRLKDGDEHVEEGCVIAEPGCASFVASDEFTCTLTILDVPNVLAVGYQCVLHLRMWRKECRVTEIAEVVDKKVRRKRFARKGDKVLARIRVASPIILTDGENSSMPMDMFALRNESLTIGLGVVRKIVRKD